MITFKTKDDIEVSIYEPFNQKKLIKKFERDLIHIDDLENYNYISVKLDLLNLKLGLYNHNEPLIIKTMLKNVDELDNNTTMLFKIKDKKITQIPFIPISFIKTKKVKDKAYLNYFGLNEKGVSEND